MVSVKSIGPAQASGGLWKKSETAQSEVQQCTRSTDNNSDCVSCGSFTTNKLRSAYTSVH